MNSGCENILRTDLVKSETLPIFVMRQSDNRIAKNIFYTANRRVPVILPFRWSLCRKKKGARLLFVYTQLTFDLKMRQSEKVSAGAPGVPDATANARNSVESILRLSNEEIAATLSRLTHEQLIEVAPFFRVVFCLIECWQGDKSSNPEKSKPL